MHNQVKLKFKLLNFILKKITSKKGSEIKQKMFFYIHLLAKIKFIFKLNKKIKK